MFSPQFKSETTEYQLSIGDECNNVKDVPVGGMSAFVINDLLEIVHQASKQGNSLKLQFKTFLIETVLHVLGTRRGTEKETERGKRQEENIDN